MTSGPQPISRAQRWALVEEIAGRVMEVHGDDVLAIGLYGSTARGTDGPYSDIEMLCVLRSLGQDYDHEWTVGPWKAEVNFHSQDLELEEAAKVDADWALTHGQYRDARPLHDPEGFFDQLRILVRDVTDAQLDSAIHEVVVGEIYELVGKLRNAMQAGALDGVTGIAVEMVRQSALALGLACRHQYRTGAELLADSLRLPGRMAGYDRLCGMVMSGQLSERAEVAAACESLWEGVAEWAAQRGITLEERNRIPF
jgi:kanamycin nucleotidyltransferase